MKILSAGAGAVGGTVAAHLAVAGADVTVVDSWYQHVEKIKSDGLRLTTPTEEIRAELPALNLDELEALGGQYDLLLLSVKSYDTAWMLRSVLPFLKPDGFVVSLQNGMNEERIASIVGAERTIGCVVHMGCASPEAGWVRRTTDPQWATLSIGAMHPSVSDDQVREVAEAIKGVGQVRIPDDIVSALWMKLAVNCMGNAMSVVTGATTRELWSDEASVEDIMHIGGEVVETAAALGVTLEPIHLSGGHHEIAPEVAVQAHHGDASAQAEVRAFWADMAEVRSGARENKASTLQDFEKGRRTEVDYLNGYIARLGAQHGVPTSYNAALPALVRRIERGELPNRIENARLVAELADVDSTISAAQQSSGGE